MSVKKLFYLLAFFMISCQTEKSPLSILVPPFETPTHSVVDLSTATTASKICDTKLPSVNLSSLPKISNSSFPPPRNYATMAYDQNRHVIVLFDSEYDTGTWEYDGMVWNQLSTSTHPPGGRMTVMAYDPKREAMVLYGDFGDVTHFYNVWEYDGKDWQEVKSVNMPENLRFPVITYHPLWEKIVLFGEYQDSATYQTWVYDGALWKNLEQDLPDIPMPSLPFQIAYDSCNQKLYLQMLGDWTYEFSSSWRIFIQCESDCSKLPLWTSTLVYDSYRDRLVHFGATWENDDGPWISETWEFDGYQWKQSQPLASPPPRVAHTLVFDEGRGVTVMFGGTAQDGTLLNDLWEYDGTTWVQR